ncbi:MAG TPA: hypothetical protein VKR53_02030 [Puia sp.]|nr:hypothetical protein [Puia sp.]
MKTKVVLTVKDNGNGIKDFVMLVFISFVIVVPISYYFMQFDFNFDNFYRESNRIHRVVSNLGSATVGVLGP